MQPDSTPLLWPAASRRAPAAELTERRARQRRSARHLRERSLSLGPSMRLRFEDESTLRWQLEQAARAARRPTAGIATQPLDAWHHLLPSGQAWCETLTIEPSAERSLRRRDPPRADEAVPQLYIEVRPHPRVFAQPCPQGPGPGPAMGARQAQGLRFGLPTALRESLLAGATAALGCLHPEYAFRRLVPSATLARLRGDLHT